MNSDNTADDMAQFGFVQHRVPRKLAMTMRKAMGKKTFAESFPEHCRIVRIKNKPRARNPKRYPLTQVALA